MVKTRDESVLKPETIQERRRIENKIIKTYNDRQELRDMLIQAYNEEVEGFRNAYNEHKKNKDGKEHLSLECLGELNRIRSLMVASSK